MSAPHYAKPASSPQQETPAEKIAFTIDCIGPTVGRNMRTRTLKGLAVGTLCAAGAVMLLGLVGRERVIPLGNGGTIQVKTASLWGSMLWSTCDLNYQPSTGKSGFISLTQSWTDYPILMIPKDGGKVLLCLFQLEDMCCQLVRFDTAKHFEKLPLGGHLAEIVQSSPWAVEVGDLDDFKYLCHFVKDMTPEGWGKNILPFPGFGISRLSTHRADLNKSDILFDLSGVAANWNSLHR